MMNTIFISAAAISMILMTFLTAKTCLIFRQMKKAKN